MKSRRVKIVLSAIAGLLAMLMVCAGWRHVRQGGFKPSASLRLVGYAKDGNGNIVATLGATNTGSSTFAVASHPRVSVLVGGVETPLDWGLYGQPPIISPHSSWSIELILPPRSQSWHCSVEVSQPTTGAEAMNWLRARGARAAIFYWFAKALPNSPSRGIKLLSPTFEIPAEFRTP